MTIELAVISVVRVLGSLPVLRWALLGALLAVLVDLSDLFMRNLLDLGGVPNYQAADKWLDQVYLGAFLVVALGWRALPGAIAVVLYLYRLAGFAVFQVIEDRWLLLAFPNVFEFWFLYVAAWLWWSRRRGEADPRMGVGQAATALVLLTGAKLGQEYVVHVARLLDGFTAVEAVQTIWDWLIPG